ncbi:MAG TPA: hypothetical protein VLW55_05140 [Burkholderiaceae bacterium]|nr:hypothetical protein [Burkholderiaceae bacterium]
MSAIRSLRLGAALALVCLCVQAAAQQSAQTDANDARRPLDANRFEIEGGYRFDFVQGHDNDGWYKIQYRGTPLALRGTASQYSDTIVLDKPKVQPGTDDRSDLNLRFEQGTLALAGGLFDMEGVKPLTFAGLEKLDLRGTAFAASDRRFTQVNFGIGLESPSLHIDALGKREIANWLVLGVNGQHREITDSSTGDRNFVAGTWRGFVGKAWFRKPQSARAIDDLAQRVYDAYVKQGASLEAAQAASKQIVAKVKRADRPYLTTNYLTTIDDDVPRELALAKARKGSDLTAEESEAIFLETLRKSARGYAVTETEERIFAVYAEVSGWYEFRASDGGGRAKNLLALSADYWFMPGRDDVFLRLRYENGFERGAPEERKNQLMLSVGLKL